MKRKEATANEELVSVNAAVTKAHKTLDIAMGNLWDVYNRFAFLSKALAPGVDDATMTLSYRERRGFVELVEDSLELLAEMIGNIDPVNLGLVWKAEEDPERAEDKQKRDAT